jgi:hypothetical protein
MRRREEFLMSVKSHHKTGLIFGFLAGIGASAWLKSRLDAQRNAQAPAAAFAGEGAHVDSPVHTRDAGPDNMRDDAGPGWDKTDQASDESFPASDPPSNY